MEPGAPVLTTPVDARRRGPMMGALFVAIAAAAVGAFIYLVPRSSVDLRVAAAGPSANSVMAHRLGNNRIVVQVSHGVGTSVRDYTFATRGDWGLSLVSLPGIRPPAVEQPKVIAFAHFADGTAMASLVMPADRLDDPDLINGGQTFFPTDDGSFAWHLVPVPPGQSSATVVNVPIHNASMAQLTAAFPPGQTPTELTVDEAYGLAWIVAGGRDIGWLQTPEQLHSADIIARARAVLPTLTALANGTIKIRQIATQEPSGSRCVVASEIIRVADGKLANAVRVAGLEVAAASGQPH